MYICIVHIYTHAELYIICIYVCMHACEYVCMCVCVYVCKYLCMYVCMHVCLLQMLESLGELVTLCARDVHKYTYIYIYIYTHYTCLATSLTYNLAILRNYYSYGRPCPLLSSRFFLWQSLVKWTRRADQRTWFSFTRQFTTLQESSGEFVRRTR